MAKYKIDPTLIADLTTYGFIDGSGDITITFAARESGVDKKYRVTFNAATDVIVATNQRMITAIEQMPSPAVNVDGTWIIGDPATTKLFVSTADASTVDPEVSGVEQITRMEKNLVVRYANMSGDKPEPAGRDKTTLGPWVTKARNYFRARKL